MRRTTTLIALVCALTMPGCFVFDAGLYQARERDAGAAPVDAGLLSLDLADDCTGAVPELVVPAGHADVSIALDTTGLTNLYSNLICTGRPAPGPDGFFQVQMTAGERWHFHVRRRGEGIDPLVFVLPSCDPRSCDIGGGLDACRVDADEHLSFVAPRTGTYFVGIDNAAGAAFEGTVQVIRPTCGNGAMEHSEPCDDANTDDGDGCDSQCRVEIGMGAREGEPNDDRFGASVLVMPAAGPLQVTGRLAALCESDMFVVDVPAGGAVSSAVWTAGASACEATELPNMELQLIAPDGITIRGAGRARGTNACPSIDPAEDTFARGLAAGRYFVRVYALNEELARPFDYTLEVAVTTP